MCINRRGVCPECATSNLYWDICDDTSSIEHHHEIARGLQRGGARSCRDHSGFSCGAGLMMNGENNHMSTPAAPAMSTFSTASDESIGSTYNAHANMSATRASNAPASLASTPRSLNMGMSMAMDMGVETAMAGVRLETPVVSWAVVSW